MADRILIKNAIVLSQDPAIGELPRADVLVEGDTIKDVRPDISADGAEVIDASGDIVIPGFVDTHRHTWETSIRSCAPDYSLGAYFAGILDRFGPAYRADDVYAANLWGALECANAGITTLVDWSHIMNTPAHADAAIRGLQESGIRAVFAYGFPNTSLQDWWLGPDYAGSRLTTDGDEARRIRKQYFNTDAGRMTMALATRGTGYCVDDVVRYEWELARELGLNITVHVAMYRFGYTKLQLRKLKDLGLLYPHTTYIHSSHLEDDEWAMVQDSGSNVSFAPQVELQMGHGWAQAVKALDHELPIGLSSDVATTTSADQFTQMHAILSSERARRHQIAYDDGLEWNEQESKLINARQVLHWATLGGAEVAGIADRTGSITPGKKADLVIIETKSPNVAPVIDPVGTVVCAADVSNVDTVIVDGGFVKRNGKLLAELSGPRRDVEASRDYLVRAFGTPEPGWLPAKTPA